MWYIHKWTNIQPYKRNEKLVHAKMWMNLESVMHCASSQAQEAMNLTIPFV